MQPYLDSCHVERETWDGMGWAGLRASALSRRRTRSAWLVVIAVAARLVGLETHLINQHTQMLGLVVSCCRRALIGLAAVAVAGRRCDQVAAADRRVAALPPAAAASCLAAAGHR